MEDSKVIRNSSNSEYQPLLGDNEVIKSDLENTFVDQSNVGNIKFLNFGKESCKNQLKSYFPVIEWVPRYNLHFLICDIIAGFTVGLTVIPQALAYAQIACLPIQYGLYSAFMGGFIYCIFGTSKDVTLGPTAIMSLLVHTYGNCDPIQAVILTFFAGIIQLFMGLFRLGFIMRYISIPVISGFTSAAAITIAFGQVKHLCGVKTKSNEFIMETIETFKNIPNGNIWDFVMGMSCIIVLLILRYLKNMVAPITVQDTRAKVFAKKLIWIISIGRNAVVVVCAALVAFAISSQEISTECKVSGCITLTGKVDEGLPPFKPPEMYHKVGNTTITLHHYMNNIAVGLLVVPLMGLLESIAIGKSFSKKGNYVLHCNQEMIAIGIANVFSSFVSSYSITGSFSRTAINSQSNVQTPAGGLVTSLLVILSLAFLTPFFYYIPKAALAAVIISSVIYMVDLDTVRQLWRTRKIDLIPLLMTFLLCFWEIPYGIVTGICVSLLFILYPVTWPKITFQHNCDDSENRYIIVHLQQGLYYCASELLQIKIRNKALDDKIHRVILDASAITSLDYTSAMHITELAEELLDKNIQFEIADLSEEFYLVLQKADCRKVIIFHSSISDALE